MITQSTVSATEVCVIITWRKLSNILNQRYLLHQVHSYKSCIACTHCWINGALNRYAVGCSRKGWMAHSQNRRPEYRVAFLSCHDIVLYEGSLFMLFQLNRRESIGRERLTTLSHRALMSRGPTNLRLRAKCG